MRPPAPALTSFWRESKTRISTTTSTRFVPNALKALQVDSTELRDILKDYPDYKLTVEGHADERGSAEYNVALGDRRASAAKDYLVGIGIPSAQLDVISYGKERPVCQEHDEDCWQRNRRIHIVATAQAQK
jgi:peptidoglycan-associated lipoprotein